MLTLDPADVEQEYQLSLLEGHPVSRITIRKKLLREEMTQGELFQDRRMGTDEVVDETLEGDLFETVLSFDEEKMSRLINWALEQSTKVQDIVFRALEDQDTIDQAISTLFPEHKTKRQVRSLSVIKTSLFHLLEQGPASVEEITQKLRPCITSRRPDAAIRQLIRRLTQEGKLSGGTNGIVLTR